MSPARKRMAALEKNKFVFVNLTKVRWIHRACTKWNTKVKKILLNLHWRNIAARNYARANRSKFAPLPRFIFHDALTLVNRSTSFVLFSFVYSLVLLLPENAKLKIDFQSAYISAIARIDTVNRTHQQHIAIQFIGFSLSISILSRWNHNDFAYIKTSYFSVNRRHYSAISDHIFLHLTLSRWPSCDGIIYEVRMNLWLVCLDRSIDSIIVNVLSLGHWGDGIFFSFSSHETKQQSWLVVFCSVCPFDVKYSLNIGKWFTNLRQKIWNRIKTS